MSSGMSSYADIGKKYSDMMLLQREYDGSNAGFNFTGMLFEYITMNLSTSDKPTRPCPTELLR